VSADELLDDRPAAMTLAGSDTSQLEKIAKAFQDISKETSYHGLANTLLKLALEYSTALRGAVLINGGSQLLSKADASFPREFVNVLASQPPHSEFHLPAELSERVLAHQEIVLKHVNSSNSALVQRVNRSGRHDFTLLCLPLVHQQQTIGILYLESEREGEALTPTCISVLSMLASQAAVSFGSAELFEALRETNMWMVKGQQIGRMGSYRWNARTMLSRASRECYRIFDIRQDINPVPFEVFRERIHPDDLPALETALADAVNAKSPFRHEYRILHQDGTILHVIAEGHFDLSPCGDVELEGIITDVTERVAAERAVAHARTELVRANRLASLGEMAGSIVHEINQPLTGIIASAEACCRWLARDGAELSEAGKSAKRVVELSFRASKVVAGLRTLVRDGQLQFGDVCVNEAVEEVLILSKGELDRDGVALKTDFDTSLPKIEADRVQLQQVVFNLVRNAIEAMADVDERAKVITVSSKLIDSHAQLTIADTGAGFDPTQKERLFDPLYTTKSHGLGIGLSICRKIITAHRGRLWVESNSAKGAAFTLAVPLRQSEPLRARNH
jgi:signal transduction histidine kinase